MDRGRIMHPQLTKSTSRRQIILAEADAAGRSALEFLLTEAGYQVISVGDGAAALGVLEQHEVAALILDATLMGSDGLSLWQTIRRTSDVPLLLLSAPVTGQERAWALHLGADDYLTKPLEPLEFVVRVQALLRRCQRPWLGAQRIRVGDLLLDPLYASVLRPGGGRVALTRQEFRVLEYLAAHSGQVLSADQILAAAWDTTSRLNCNLVAVYIRRLRIKLELDAAKPTYIGSTMDGYVFLTKAGCA